MMKTGWFRRSLSYYQTRMTILKLSGKPGAWWSPTAALQLDMPMQFSRRSKRSMAADSYLLSVIDGSRKGPAASMLRTGLAALAYIYAAGLKLYLLPYKTGIRRQTRPPCKVISI